MAPASEASRETARAVLTGSASGPVIATREALSFWGGIDPANGAVIDVHHPLHGQSITGEILMMPTSRGSCTGSGVLLDLVLAGRGPAALVFTEPEDVLTLGALVAAQMFGHALPVIRLPRGLFDALAEASQAEISPDALSFGGHHVPLLASVETGLDLTPADRAMLDGAGGTAVQQAMRIIATMAVEQGAARLIDVTQVHIDGCIYASPANLTFAEAFADMGAKVAIPATMNAISVDRSNWQSQGVPAAFGAPAARLADAYVRMGCKPTFTCSPYLLESAPVNGEVIAWSESNAVIFANSVLGARTTKHPDFLDLCIALTGRAPESGVYLSENRRPRRVIDVDLPTSADDSFWPLIGYLAGKKAPDCVPLLRGLAAGKPSRDDLKALCAAFGTTSGAPLLHIEGMTPEADLPPHPAADHVRITRADMVEAWRLLQDGPEDIDLVAIGSPHASLEECLALAAALAAAGPGASQPEVPIIVTAGRQVIAALEQDGTLERLKANRVQVLPDLCWCSISEPVFPPQARSVMTNSGKYAHYGPGLSGRAVRFGSLADCVEAARTGRVALRLPEWLR